MNKIQIKNQILELIKKIELYSEEYYINSNSMVSDYEFDLLMKELENLENEYPNLKTKTSPTMKIGFEAQEFFEKEYHEFPMLSIQNALNIDQFELFLKRTKKDLDFKEDDKLEFSLEPKIDGVSISLIYEDGILVKALTRGDGKIGERVTKNIYQIASIPKKINFKEKIIVRGEIYSKISNFNNINKKLKNDEEKEFANPRNFASGTIRNLDSEIVKKRNLDAYFYQVIFYGQKKLSKQSDILKFLKENNFPIFENYKISNSKEEIFNILNDFDKMRLTLDFEIDGVVLKINDHLLYEKIGTTTKFPKWAIAFKFPPKIVKTKLLDIFQTIGRTGLVTYNAKLEPVNLMGSKISFATLHNLEYIKKMDLRIGDFVEIKKSGEIIPKVIRPSISDRLNNKLDIWVEDEFCISCKEKLFFSETKNNQYCKNKNCKSIQLQILLHFISKKAMNIDGLGEKNIELFFDQKNIKHPIDLFYLTREDLLSLQGFQERSAFRILQQIENSKQNSLEKLIFALGINHIGQKASLDLAKNFKSLENITNLSFDELINFKDFGEVKAKSIISFFKDQNNIEIINKMKVLKINFEYLENNSLIFENNKSSKFYKKIVLITGTFEDLKRTEAEQILTSLGAIIRKTSSSKLDFIISGSKPSSNKINSIDERKIIKTNLFRNIL